VLLRLASADRQIDRLEMLIHRLLDVSQIAAGRIQLDRERFDLTELVRDVIERFTSPEAPIRTVASGDLVGTWDRFRLDQVLTNLVSNALKYGQKKPVEVTLEDRGMSVRCSVRDQGIGILPEAQARIFERFERAVSPSHFVGFGLGLWIARQIVERHGGSITVSSLPGVGSTFVFELPRASGPEVESGMGSEVRPGEERDDSRAPGGR
jgi:signal transduction histidine kinase